MYNLVSTTQNASSPQAFCTYGHGAGEDRRRERQNPSLASMTICTFYHLISALDVLQILRLSLLTFFFFNSNHHQEKKTFDV